MGATLAPQSREELFLPGQARERQIAGGETHLYRAKVMDLPLLVTVEQQGIDLVIEDQGPSGTPLASDAGSLRWGPEVVLLETPGEHRLAVRPRELAVFAGRYTIRLDAVPASSEAEERRRAALSLMSRAGREAFEQDPAARHRALALYREALTAWSELKEPRWEAASLSAMATLERLERELLPATRTYLQALALWRKLGEPHGEATMLNDLGLTRLYMGELKAAREDWQNALSLWRRLEARFDEGETRSNLCFLEQKSGAPAVALACLEEPLALFRALGDQSQEARILNNIGGLYDLLGEPDAALEAYRKALALRQALADRPGEAQTLNNIAVVHRSLGEWQEALRVYGEVLEILAPLGDRLQEASLLNNIGFTYNSLGEPQRALAFLGDALKLRRDVGDRLGEIITLNNLGDSWRELGDLEKALGLHRQALELAMVLGDGRQETLSRTRLAETRLARGDATAALRELEPALTAVRDAGNPRSEIEVLYLQGSALAAAGRRHEALAVLQRLPELCRSLHDRTSEAGALQALAKVEQSLGRTREARVHAQEAVTQVEELRRTGFVSPHLRATFLATQRRAYSLLIDLLMDQHAADPGGGHDRTAFAVSERARARSLLDILHSGNGVGSTVPARLLERRQLLRRQLSAKTDQQLKESGAKADALWREVEVLLAELDRVEAEIRRVDPDHAVASEPRSLGLNDMPRLLDPDTLLLEYALGEKQSYLWEVGAGSFRSFILPPERDIEELARRVYEELSTYEAGTGRRGRAAEDLSRILLSPVWPDAARSKRLVVVPDGALHVLPFGALPAPGSRQPILDQLEIVHLPSLTTLALQRERLERRPPASRWAAVIADPVFAPDDSRLARPATAAPRPPSTRSGPARDEPESGGPLSALARLPATGREADMIKALAPAGQVYSALGVMANRETVLSGKLRDTRVVHFGTHGLADTRNPELSGLVLSLVDAAGRPQEGFLGLSDIYDLDLDADLVVLSGCRTALGRELRGEGVMGLTRGFLHAGAPRVVASLWQVADRSTAELMIRFYRALWQDRLPPAAALREAQQSLRRDPRYRSPYSWAGFVLHGDWR